MKATENQKVIIEILANTFYGLEFSNDISSPTISNDLERELLEANIENQIDNELANDIVICFNDMLELIKRKV